MTSRSLPLAQPINCFSELIDALAALGLELDSELLEIDLRFPLLSELEVQTSNLGTRVIGA